MKTCGKCHQPATLIAGHKFCDKCQIVEPSSEEAIREYIGRITEFRSHQQAYLHDLLQKEHVSSKDITPEEKSEIDLWNEHNKIITELKPYKSLYNCNSIREEKIYPLLYQYIKIAERIKVLYPTLNLHEKQD